MIYLMSSLSLKSADYILKYFDAKYELLFEKLKLKMVRV
jgi:hypothetical protein